MTAAIKILSGRSGRTISSAELEQRLIKDFADLENVDQKVNDVIENLQNLHFISDWRLAINIVLRYLHKGNSYIKEILAKN